jgi:two-component system response regulator HydG
MLATMSARSRPSDSDRRSGATRGGHAPAIHGGGVTPRVLVLEGDRHMADLLEDWLGSAGYCPIPAGGGASVPAVHSGSNDVVLADIASPRDAAAAVVARLRSTFPGTPVVLMSGYFLTSGGTAAAEITRQLGVAGILPKPFTRDALLGMLGRLVPLVPGK